MLDKWVYSSSRISIILGGDGLISYPEIFQDARLGRDEGMVWSRPCPIGRRSRRHWNVADI